MILKIPFDLGILDKNKRGTSEFPKLIKEGTTIPVNRGNFEETQKNIEEYALREYKNGKKVIGVGGDHSVSYGLIKAFDRSYKNKGLIYFDAHPDCQDYFLPPTYENILRCVIKDTRIYPNILLVGVREITKAEKEFINNKKLKITRDIKDIKRFLEKTENVYVSLDVDVLDPKFAPGTGEPVKGGLLPTELKEMLKEIINSKKLRGADLVEVCPKLDKNNKTIKLATELLENFLTL